MTVIELKKSLIGKINQSQNNEILEEMYRLIVNEEPDDKIYELSEEQENAVNEAQIKFMNGQFLKGEQADNEIEEWLSK